MSIAHPERHRINELVANLETNIDAGLSTDKAKQLFQNYGANEIKEKAKGLLLRLIVDQFSNILIFLLLVAAALSFFVGETIDAVAILSIVLINAVLGFAQEYKAERSLASLKKAEKLQAVVLRDGKESNVEARELVPGDVLILSEGEKIPADLRIVEAVNLSVDESLLTGESRPVEKKSHTINKAVPLHERNNMLFAGTLITRGRGKAVVVATAMETQLGQLATELESIDRERTPLQKALSHLAKVLAAVALLVSLPGIGFGLLVGRPWEEMLVLAISLAVSVVPEGLPVVVTIALALGVKRMLSAKVLVRRLSTTETLGSSNLICTDKTGTITQNKMTVREFALHKKHSKELLLKAAVLVSDATAEVGDPTERALLVAAEKANLDTTTLREKSKRKSELPFSAENKYMVTLVDDGSSLNCYCKGAPEVVLAKTNLTKKEQEKYEKQNLKFASQGLRVLAVARKKTKRVLSDLSRVNDFEFLGLVAMYDPPRKEVQKALADCKQAGIRVMLLTGDNKKTAQIIAKEVGFENTQAVEGFEIEKLSDEELRSLVERVAIFARVTPQQKLKLLTILQGLGYQVAMTGDGVNDAAAIKKADVGVALGSGTDLSKEVADMVILDDNFSSIVLGIKEARRIFFNIKKFVMFLLSANFDEVLKVLSSLILGLPLSMLPIHILWINLATDSLPALALASDAASPEIMRRKPYDTRKEILKGVFSFSVVAAFFGYLYGFGAFLYLLLMHSWSVPRLQTLVVISSVLFELLLLFSVRSSGFAFAKKNLNNPILFAAVGIVFLAQLLVIYNPIAQSIFKFEAMGRIDWMIATGIALASFLSVESYKYSLLYFRRDPSGT